MKFSNTKIVTKVKSVVVQNPDWILIWFSTSSCYNFSAKPPHYKLHNACLNFYYTIKYQFTDY